MVPHTWSQQTGESRDEKWNTAAQDLMPTKYSQLLLWQPPCTVGQHALLRKLKWPWEFFFLLFDWQKIEEKSNVNLPWHVCDLNI